MPLLLGVSILLFVDVVSTIELSLPEYPLHFRGHADIEEYLQRYPLYLALAT